jgi:hypothetical protein
VREGAAGLVQEEKGVMVAVLLVVRTAQGWVWVQVMQSLRRTGAAVCWAGLAHSGTAQGKGSATGERVGAHALRGNGAGVVLGAGGGAGRRGGWLGATVLRLRRCRKGRAQELGKKYAGARGEVRGGDSFLSPDCSRETRLG